MLDRAKVAAFLGTVRPHVLRQAIHNTGNLGVVSIVGVYGGFVDKIPMGSAINRGLTFRMAQTQVQHYLPKLMAQRRERRHRPVFRRHAPGSAREGTRDVQGIPRQAGRLHQGDDASQRLKRLDPADGERDQGLPRQLQLRAAPR